MISKPVTALPSPDGFDLPTIPAIIFTVGGQKIETSAPLWEIRAAHDGGQLFYFDWSKPSLLDQNDQRFSERAWHLIQLYIADRLARKAAGTVKEDFIAFRAFERWLAIQYPITFLQEHGAFNWSHYNEGIARAFLAYGLQQTASKGKHFSLLRCFYHWGVARTFPDFSSAMLRLLESIKAAGNLKGHHVRFRDPVNGPFSPDEKRLIKQALDAEQGHPTDRAIVMLHYELGLHPAAVARLKNRDLRRYEVNGETFYQLDVPRVKKRTVVRETRRRPISQRLGQLLEGLQQGAADAPLLSWLSPKQPQMTLYKALQRFVEVVDLRTPATGGHLHLSACRFRYTLATQMAEEGASNLHIAEMLDHTDLQNVAVYTATTSSIADLAAQATDQALTPLVQRFLGKIVASAQTPAFEGLPNQLIPGNVPHLPQVPLNIGAVGMCGRDVRRDGLCQLFPPLSCYLCPSFAALRTGPHVDLLQSLEAYLQANQAQIDQRILLQLTEILTAIREVVAQLRHRSQEDRA